MNMISCSYLDPASLLAQSAVSIRLGRRASNCSHTLLATARRAPLNESSVQGSIKQPSTAASAPAQVLQSVGIDHTGGHDTENGGACVDRLLPPRQRHGESRRRGPPALPSRESAFEAALNGTAEGIVEELTPPLHLEPAEQPAQAPDLHRAYGDGELDVARPQQHGANVWASSRYDGVPAAPRGPAPQLGSAAELDPPGGYSRLPYEQDQQWSAHRPGGSSTAVSPQQQRVAGVSAGPKQRGVLPSGHAATPQPLQSPQRPRPLAADWGQNEQLLMPAAATASAATAIAIVDADLELDADAAAPWAGHSRSYLAASTSAGNPAVATTATAAATLQRGTGAVFVSTSDRQPPARGEPSSPSGLPPQPPDEPPGWSDGPVGGRWGGLESELLACRSCHSVQRFLQLMGPRVDAELMGNAIVHLSHLVAEEPPDGTVERQLLAGLLDNLTLRLRGSARQLGWGLLTATVCAMSRLRCFDGPLLREAAAAAREAAAELTARQTGGLVWAFGRYRRDFGLRLEPDWVAALLTAVLPRLAAEEAKPHDVAMMLYGTALLQESPPPLALDGLLAESLRGMPAAAGPDLAMSIWALATLRLHPGREWLCAFLDRCDGATRTFASGASVCNVLYGLAAMRVQPPATWMLNFLWQAQRRMNDMDAGSLVMLGWALGRMRYRPDRKWLTRFFRYSQATVLLQPRDSHTALGISTQQLARQPPGQEAVQAASQRQVELWRRQQQRMEQRLQQRMQRPEPWGGDGSGAAEVVAASPPPVRRAGAAAEALALPPQAFNVLLWACVRLSCRPMGRWLPHLCAAVQPRLASWPPAELSALLWGLARLGCRPRDDWMTEYCAAARGGLARFQPPDCVMTLLALSRLCSGLGYRVSDGDLANGLAARLAPYYPRLQTTTLISVLLAISRVTPRVRPARLEEALVALLDRVRAIGVATTSGTAAAAVPADADADAPADLAPAAQQQYLQQDRPPSPPPPQLQDGEAAVMAPSSALPPLTARECANAIFAVGSVALWPGYNEALRSHCGALLRELLPRASRLLLAPGANSGSSGSADGGQFNGVDLVLLLHGVAMSRSRVGLQWLRLHEEQAARVLRAGGLRPGQLHELRRAYHALDYEPELLPPPSSGSGSGSGCTGHSGMLGAAAGREEDDEGVGAGSVVEGAGAPGGSEGEGEGARSAELSEAARARRRRAAQGRRRRVTAAIERRVVEVRRRQSGVAAAQQQQQEHAGAAEGGGELQAAERDLRHRRATIRRHAAVAKRGGDASGR